MRGRGELRYRDRLIIVFSRFSSVFIQSFVFVSFFVLWMGNTSDRYPIGRCRSTFFFSSLLFVQSFPPLLVCVSNVLCYDLLFVCLLLYFFSTCVCFQCTCCDLLFVFLSLYFCNQCDLTSLHVACKNGHDKVVQMLIDGGADVDAKDYVRFLSM